MSITELVEKHGFGITVSCNKVGYPPFKIISKIKDKEFTCQTVEQQSFIFVEVPWIKDYEIIPEKS